MNAHARCPCTPLLHSSKLADESGPRGPISPAAVKQAQGKSIASCFTMLRPPSWGVSLQPLSTTAASHPPSVHFFISHLAPQAVLADASALADSAPSLEPPFACPFLRNPASPSICARECLRRMALGVWCTSDLDDRRSHMISCPACALRAYQPCTGLRPGAWRYVRLSRVQLRRDEPQ